MNWDADNPADWPLVIPLFACRVRHLVAGHMAVWAECGRCQRCEKLDPAPLLAKYGEREFVRDMIEHTCCSACGGPGWSHYVRGDVEPVPMWQRGDAINRGALNEKGPAQRLS